jgi:hypothetical protein
MGPSETTAGAREGVWGVGGSQDVVEVKEDTGRGGRQG